MNLSARRDEALRHLGVFKQDVRTRLVHEGRRRGIIPDRKPDAYKAGQVGQVSRTADEVQTALAGKKSIGIYGNQAFSEVMAEAVVGATWISHRLDDLAAGAIQVSASTLEQFDAVVVGGPDLNMAYANLLHHVKTQTNPPMIQWVGDGFEMSGSTLPVPASVNEAHIYLFHHFDQLFGVKDPLLVEVSVRGETIDLSFQELVAPGATAFWRLSELAFDRSEAVVIEVRTQHPKLSGCRHQRWRVWADVISGDSIASLHGAHDFGPNHRAEAVLPTSNVGTAGRYELVIPNYDGELPADSAVRLGTGTTQRSTAPLTVLHVPAQVAVPYSYQGHGTAFWFGFDASGSLSANHEANVSSARDEYPMSVASRSRLAAASSAGFVPSLHLLPLCGTDLGLQFGASIDWANPMPRSLRVCVFNSAGVVISDEIRTDLKSEIWAPEVAANIPGASIVGIAPDFVGCDLDPQAWTCMFNLVARQASGDRDATEFQSSWRNLGVSVPGFPHWLHESKGVRGSTSVVGRWTTNSGWRTFLMAVNGSGSLSYTTTAALSVSVLGTNGAVVENHDVSVGPFGSSWLEIGLMTPSERGSLVVQSSEADFTCQVVTITPDQAVGLQHLWGY